jgi:uncharacterized repeat protein (TIGR01451 family)
MLSSAERYDPATNAWSTAGSLATAREYHSATLLPSGKVLVVGGNSASTLGTALSSAELYDPSTNTWSAAGALSVRRTGHTATLLPSGKVLVAGGYTGTSTAASAELYDPSTNAWSAAGTMAASRIWYTATLLPSGKVLVAGGFDGSLSAVNSAEIYDPVTNAWSTAGTLAAARAVQTATPLPSGKVLIAGGEASSVRFASVELFEPGLSPTAALQPSLSAVNAFLLQTSLLAATSSGSSYTSGTVTATGLRPKASASGGAAHDSATNNPVFQIERLDNQQQRFIANDATVSFTDTTFTGSATALAGFPAGPVLMRVWVNGVPSAARYSTLAMTPGQPAAPTATGGTQQAAVAFTPVGETGGVPITSYTATASPGGATASCTAPCTSITFNPMAVGTYTFTVHATTAAGNGPESPASNSVQVAPPMYTVGGTVSGLAGSGLVLSLNSGAQNLPVSANGTFTFPTAITSGSTYAVTVGTQPSSQICTITSGSGMVTAANITNVSVICASNAYTVGGSVSGLAGSGLVLSLNNGAQNLPISANGTFTFPTAIASGSTYAVTVGTQPSSPTQTCTVTNGSSSIGSANVTNVSVACTTNTYTVGGSVSGLAGSGLVLALNNGAQNLPISANGTFTFPAAIASGSTYAVTVGTQPSSPTQTCTVTNGSSSVGSASITNVAVACTTNAYTIGGSATGIDVSGLVLQLNGGSNLAVNANGAFTFTTPIASGSTYTVTMLSQPAGRSCTLTNASGTVTAADVTNVSVACFALTQLVLSATDDRLFARYGHIVDYAVTLANNGDGGASNVSVTFMLSAGFDGAAAQLTCSGAGNGATCTQDSLNPLIYHVALPAHRSLSWLVSVPVRSDAAGSTIDFSVGATGAASVTDTDTLVIFRDGFDVLNGDGTQTLPVIEGAQAQAILDGDVLHDVMVPIAPSATTQPLLLVRDGARELRVDWRSFSGLDLVRLLERDANGRERATPWSLTQAGAMLELGSEAMHDDVGVDHQEAASRETVLVGAAPPPSLRH